MNMNKSNLHKYFIYARKSSESEDRQMASIEDQISELEKIATENNLEVVDVLSEAKSAKAPGRKVFSDMVDRINKGEANGIIAWKLNRLARNPIDGGTISWMLQQGVLQHIQTFGRSYYPSDNVIVMAVELGMANQFVRDLSIDSKRGVRNKAERGWYPAQAPIGYLSDPLKRKGEKEIVEDPERFMLVRKMFDLVLTGMPPQKVLEIATNDWGLRNIHGKKFSRSGMYGLLNNPFYYGEFEFPKNSGNWYKGKHVPMITEEEYEKVRTMLGSKATPRSKKREFAFRGPLKCGECHGGITAEVKRKIQKNGNVHIYVYYHCTKRKDPSCKQGSIEEKVLEKQILDVLGDIEIPTEFTKWALGVIRDQNKSEIVSREQILRNQRRQYDILLKKIDNLIDMRANGEISEQIMKSKMNQYNIDKDRLESVLRTTESRVDEWVEVVENSFKFAEKARRSFENGDLGKKKEILSALGSNLTIKDGKLSVCLPKPLSIIKSGAQEAREIAKGFEPLDTNKNIAIYNDSKKLLRLLDDVRTCLIPIS